MQFIQHSYPCLLIVSRANGLILVAVLFMLEDIGFSFRWVHKAHILHTFGKPHWYLFVGGRECGAPLVKICAHFGRAQPP